MDAKEARKRALEIDGDLARRNYDDVMKSINEAVELGKFVTRFYDPIRDDVKKVLEDKGYTLNYVSSVVNEYDWIIKW